jgi:hypothetical protein
MAEVPVFNYQFGSTLGAGPMGFPSGAFNTGGAYTSESSGDEDYWRYSPPVDGVNLFNFPSFESFRAGQSGGATPTVGSTFSGGAGSTGFGGIDAAGPVRMDPFTVSTTPFTGSTVFDYAFPGTSGLAGQGGGAAGAGGAVQGPTVMEPFVVPGTRVPQVGNLNVLGYDPNAPIPGPTAPVTPIGTGSQPPVQLPTVTVEATKPSGERPNWFEENLKNVYNTTTVLPPFTVTPGPDKKPDENIPVVNTTSNRFNVPAPIAGPLTVVGPSQGQTQQVGPTVATGEGPAPSTGTTGSTGGGTSGTGPQRDFAKELGATLAGLQQYQPQLLSMYKDLYQSFMPQGLTAAETSGLAQMRADEEKLNRLRQGILSPEDIRTATQGAREAYGARGQVFAPGAIGAEILNREAIRQQREDQARAAYQQSIGNLLNVSNLQTGNIFQPISSLLSGTFNPLGAYPADVYGTNVNAALARDIAERNKEAAIESARMAGAAGTSAAKTSAAGSIGAAVLPSVIAALPSIFCWVAREVYGEHNPRWQMFRHWMLTRAPRWFFRLYLRHGEKFAKWLKRNPWLKPMIRRWMDSRIESMRPNHALKEAF